MKQIMILLCGLVIFYLTLFIIINVSTLIGGDEQVSTIVTGFSMVITIQCISTFLITQKLKK